MQVRDRDLVLFFYMWKASFSQYHLLKRPGFSPVNVFGSLWKPRWLLRCIFASEFSTLFQCFKIYVFFFYNYCFVVNLKLGLVMAPALLFCALDFFGY